MTIWKAWCSLKLMLGPSCVRRRAVPTVRWVSGGSAVAPVRKPLPRVIFAGLIVAHWAAIVPPGVVPKMNWRTASDISGLPQLIAKLAVIGDGPSCEVDELSENVRRVLKSMPVVI